VSPCVSRVGSRRDLEGAEGARTPHSRGECLRLCCEGGCRDLDDTKRTCTPQSRENNEWMTGTLSDLPKAELHLHIEGTLEPELVFELARKNGVQLPFASVDDLRDRYRFSDLQSFLNLYYECMTVLRTAQDFDDLATRYFQRANADGVRHVELFFDPQAHTSRGVPIDDVMDGLLSAAERARQDFGITGGLILCFLRDQTVESASATLESVAHRVGDLLGVGLDSAEVGHPPRGFQTIFDRARALGLHAVAHAGEEGPPSYIWEALDLLHAERIDHGIRALEDPLLVERLRTARVSLTVCPLSNVRLGVVSDLAAHPLPTMLAEGLLVCINSDDPAYFGGYLGANLAGVAEAFDFGDTELAQLARNSIEASFATEERKAELLTDVDEWMST
jgi:adenosine deaminase